MVVKQATPTSTTARVGVPVQSYQNTMHTCGPPKYSQVPDKKNLGSLSDTSKCQAVQNCRFVSFCKSPTTQQGTNSSGSTEVTVA